MKTLIKNLSPSHRFGPTTLWQDETSGIDNLDSQFPRAPIVVGIVIIGFALMIGVAVGFIIGVVLVQYF